ncbi:aspartic peptidase domain-containing protein [Suillus ampliporus]|nr:aspartic peptidase domain-containing protein [Suillus ampliporus]
MINQGLLDKPIFSFRFGDSEADGGEVTFGDIDPGAYTGNISYVPVRRKAYWEVRLDKVTFGDDELELNMTGAAIDTDRSLLCTSLLALAIDIAKKFNTQIGTTLSANGRYQVDCATFPSLPELTFYFGGKPYALNGSDYVVEDRGTCISSLTSMDINLPGGSLCIVGDVFLRRYYTVYDLGRNAVGFAKGV